MVANLIKITQNKNTDNYLKFLLSIGYNNKFISPTQWLIKILTLYTARNTVKIDTKLLFQLNSKLASVWYFNYFLFDSYADKNTTTNIINHIKTINVPLDLTFCLEKINFAYNISTYYDSDNDKFLKQKLNSLVQNKFKNIKIINNPNKSKIAIITRRWIKESVIYKSMFQNIKELSNDYELTLINTGKEFYNNGSYNNIFKDIKHIEFEDYLYYFYNINIELNYSSQNPKLINLNNWLAPILDNEFIAIIFLDIGLDIESIYLSNLRIAPIQISCYGHPVSTYGSCIDYFIGGSEVENIKEAEKNYSERLVIIPGLGANFEFPEINIPITTNTYSDYNKIIINCPWGPNKFNYNTLKTLKTIISRANRNIVFRFFIWGRANNSIPLKMDILEILGSNNVELLEWSNYEDYLKILTNSHLSISPLIFTGYNTVIDSLLLGIPIVTFEGNKAYDRLGPAVLRRLNLNELIVNNIDNYIELTLKLINNDEYRITLSNKIKNIDIKKSLFYPNEPKYFKKAIDFLIKNHFLLKKDTNKCPIIIKP